MNQDDNLDSFDLKNNESSEILNKKDSEMTTKILIPARNYNGKAPAQENLELLKPDTSAKSQANFDDDDCWGSVDETPKFTKLQEVQEAKTQPVSSSAAKDSFIKIPTNPYKKAANPPTATVLVEPETSRNFRGKGKRFRGRYARNEDFGNRYQDSLEEAKSEPFAKNDRNEKYERFEKIDKNEGFEKNEKFEIKEKPEKNPETWLKPSAEEKTNTWLQPRSKEEKADPWLSNKYEGEKSDPWLNRRPAEVKEEEKIHPTHNLARNENIEKSANSGWPNFGKSLPAQAESFDIKTLKLLKCPSGEKCKGCFKYHYEGEKRRDLDKHNYYPVMCPRGAACHLNDKCGKSHNFFEIYYHPQVYKTTYCSNMLKFKNCALGNYCNGLHFVDENSASATKPFLCRICLKEDVNFMRTKCGHVCCTKCAAGDICKKCLKPSEIKKFVFD